MNPPLADNPGLVLLIWAATPDRPELLATPLIHALAARALDCEVEIHFAGPAVRWLVEGVAAAQFAGPNREKSLLEFLQDAVSAGASLHLCSMAQAAWIAPQETLLPLCSGPRGATAFVARTLQAEWKTLVY
ncbi:MAG: hypothetical protein RIR00_950 [Pseudomonadota bacterium]|jgi:predicted peroxiredoxin